MKISANHIIIKVFEITDFGSSEKSNKNKLAALMKKNDLGLGSRKIFYSLVIFECRYWTNGQ